MSVFREIIQLLQKGIVVNFDKERNNVILSLHVKDNPNAGKFTHTILANDLPHVTEAQIAQIIQREATRLLNY